MKYFEIDDFTFETLLSIFQLGTEMQNDIEKFLHKFNISHGRFSILLAMYKRLNEWVSPSYLSDELKKKKPTITGMIKKLAEEGLIVQVDNTTDARGKLFKLSNQGYKLLGKIIPEYNKRIIKMGEHLTDDEKMQLKQILGKIKI